MNAIQKLTQDALQRVPGWEASGDGLWLKRRYAFKNFRQALAFVNKVGELAEEARHHPDITFGWGYCELALQTHDIGGVSEKDLQLAARINELENV